MQLTLLPFVDSQPAQQGLGVLSHPEFVVRDFDADIYTFKNHYQGPTPPFVPRICKLILTTTKSLILRLFKSLHSCFVAIFSKSHDKE